MYMCTCRYACRSITTRHSICADAEFCLGLRKSDDNTHEGPRSNLEIWVRPGCSRFSFKAGVNSKSNRTLNAKTQILTP